MKKTLIAAIAIVAFALAACASKPKTESAPAPKVLVLYYSQTGATKTVAEEIQKQLGADIEAIDVEEPYDGDFGQTIQRCQQEMAEGKTPVLKPIKSVIADYDVIFLGYPIWFGTYAPPIASLLKAETFEGKKVVTFCTFGSGGLQPSSKSVKDALPKAEVIEGYGVRNARVSAAATELNRFLIEAGYKAGEVEALPAYGEQQPVTEEETKIFDAACGDYQFPLGTPVTVASRKTSTSTDYLYTVNSKGQTGEDVTTQIYVTVSNSEGAKPEFTQVVR